MRPTCVIVMGPSGSGKTTTATLLAARLNWAFAEADDFHSPGNIAKMKAGVALDDADRAPWLQAIRDWINRQACVGQNCVVTCSALKRIYRDGLRQADARVRFLQLDLPPELLRERVAQRLGHYMPPSLLDSQLSALEPLAADEDGAKISASGNPETVVEQALSALALADSVQS